jgi:hypothetical protein
MRCFLALKRHFAMKVEQLLKWLGLGLLGYCAQIARSIYQAGDRTERKKDIGRYSSADSTRECTTKSSAILYCITSGYAE